MRRKQQLLLYLKCAFETAAGKYLSGFFFRISEEMGTLEKQSEIVLIDVPVAL